MLEHYAALLFFASEILLTLVIIFLMTSVISWYVHYLRILFLSQHEFNELLAMGIDPKLILYSHLFSVLGFLLWTVSLLVFPSESSAVFVGMIAVLTPLNIRSMPSTINYWNRVVFVATEKLENTPISRARSQNRRVNDVMVKLVLITGACSIGFLLAGIILLTV